MGLETSFNKKNLTYLVHFNGVFGDIRRIYGIRLFSASEGTLFRVTSKYRISQITPKYSGHYQVNRISPNTKLYTE